MIILGTNSIKDTGFNVANSLRFNSGSSDSLDRTVSSSPTNPDKFTISVWVKRSKLGSSQAIIGQYSDSNFRAKLQFIADDKLEYYQVNDGSASAQVRTTRVFRDTSAWYNIVMQYDSAQSTSSNRLKLYVNGTQETAFDNSSYPAQNLDGKLNQASVPLDIGQDGNSSLYFDGYMAEAVVIDGTALDPTSFGEFDEDSGIWKPIDVSGLTFGTNGFYLEFKESGTGTNASGMGADTSGNTNHFAVNNLTAIDQSTDTCTNNFATLNPLNYSSVSKTYSFGNTAITASASGSWNATLSNFAVSSGKWYTEYKITAVGSYSAIGVGYQPFNTNASAYVGSTFLVGEDTGSFGWRNNGARPQGGSNLSSWGTNDILMIAIDMDNQKLYFGKNGTWETSGDPTSGATGTGSIGNLTAGEDYLFVICPRGGGTSVNFGSPSFAISSGNTDGDGYGNFEYAVPSGYFSLNTKNLAEYG